MNLSFFPPLPINPLKLLTYMLKSLMVSLRSSKYPCSSFTLKKPSCKSSTANSKVPRTNFFGLLWCFWGVLVHGVFYHYFWRFGGLSFFVWLDFVCLSSILQPEELRCSFTDIDLLHCERPSRK